MFEFEFVIPARTGESLTTATVANSSPAPRASGLIISDHIRRQNYITRPISVHNCIQQAPEPCDSSLSWIDPSIIDYPTAAHKTYCIRTTLMFCKCARQETCDMKCTAAKATARLAADSMETDTEDDDTYEVLVSDRSSIQNRSVCLLLQILNPHQMQSSLMGATKRFILLINLTDPETQEVITQTVCWVTISAHSTRNTCFVHHVFAEVDLRAYVKPVHCNLRFIELKSLATVSPRAHHYHPTLHRSEEVDDIPMEHSMNRAYRDMQDLDRVNSTSQCSSSSDMEGVVCFVSADNCRIHMDKFVVYKGSSELKKVIRRDLRAPPCGVGEANLFRCCEQSVVLRLIRQYMYTGQCAPCRLESFDLCTLIELIECFDRFNITSKSADCQRFFDACILHYGLGTAAMHESRESYASFLWWMLSTRAVRSEALLISCHMYFDARWGSDQDTPADVRQFIRQHFNYQSLCWINTDTESFGCAQCPLMKELIEWHAFQPTTHFLCFRPGRESTAKMLMDSTGP